MLGTDIDQISHFSIPQLLSPASTKLLYRITAIRYMGQLPFSNHLVTPNLFQRLPPLLNMKLRISLKFVGVLAAMSYVICITGSWMLANLNGHTYFQAGEPVAIIKYVEWILAGISIYTLWGYALQEATATKG